MRVSFIIEGKPLGWQRTGQNYKTKSIYTPEKTRQHEQLVAWAYKRQCRGFRFPNGSCLDMRVIAHIPIPQSTAKASRQMMLSGEIRPTVKPDWDNIGKLIADALNDIAYDDDKCIVDAQVRKFYSDKPRTLVILQEATNE